MRSTTTGFLALALLALAVQPLRAQETEKLNFWQRSLAVLTAEQNLDHPQPTVAARQVPARQLVQVWAYTVPQTDGHLKHLVEVTHFDYQGGVTIRTTVDLTRPDHPQVVGTERLTAYPAPLAPEELNRARSLAREIPEIRMLYVGHPKVHDSYLVPVIADSDNPKFGHRLVRLFVNETGANGTGLRVDVDLTDSTATLARGH